MIIGIDGNEANVEERVGVSEYAFELLQQFKKYQISNIKYQIYLKSKPLEHMPEEAESWHYRVVRPHKLWTQIALPFDLFFHYPKPNVFFSPTHYAPRFSPVPTVISIMDLSYIHYPEMFRKSDLYQLKNWTKYSAQNASMVFTISQASKDDIIKEYKIPKDKIVVTYPGIKIKDQKSKIKNTMQSLILLKDKYGIEGRYILFVGTLQPRKNIIRLIEAFSKIKDLDIKLVVVGKRGWLYQEILSTPERIGIEDRVKFLEFVTDDNLTILYQNALCFVLPSLYEGFGLPILEAMANGCPVITSRVSSLPEAGGDACLYVDPEDVDDIASKMMAFINDEKLRAEFIKKGYQQVKKFSWEKTAKETLKVLEAVAKNNIK